MPMTPDSQLTLLFSPDLIPNSVRDALPSDLHVRPLAVDDYHRGHLEVLKVLSVVNDPGFDAYRAHFESMLPANTSASKGQTYYVISIVSKQTDKVVATGSVFIERKFLRGLGSVGHIEDIAVSKDMQGKKLGLRVIQTLVALSEKAGCYKTILNCSDENIPFYEKCGFKKKENEMAKYATDSTTPGRL
ncbi:SubName: Full=Related to glucosamine 6-phosphate n-acetyltransferase {ECO:0000313/EMBL:CCA68354.1} [Serendipita indica DSM 11827]|uniref:Glucosamine 6-phosphate N-acetyltransferase n=1 Tax=Serendipita indica (strain DSM 11827) TaxID=1109443 RepID=G4TAL1_SERID|nr:SubName: Full=Related to glucosamine 6-phosphate n-acetyltransferase {ECO:0000313/EMBL:CCA68354.1} [Serendipita indica DSM 11827]CCA68354.1 related to glucosamine 6-phosphate n-acetyltransferase [Serendipita indica DSM 11827]